MLFYSQFCDSGEKIIKKRIERVRQALPEERLPWTTVRAVMTLRAVRRDGR